MIAYSAITMAQNKSKMANDSTGSTALSATPNCFMGTSTCREVRQYFNAEINIRIAKRRVATMNVANCISSSNFVIRSSNNRRSDSISNNISNKTL